MDNPMTIRNAARVVAGTLSLAAMWAAFLCYMGSLAPTLDGPHHLAYAGLAVVAAVSSLALGIFALKEPEDESYDPTDVLHVPHGQYDFGDR